ncbi:aminotransferase class I/II-fold pyridoxal phosphate-dependent enzyme, partial [Dermatophilus congolensis]
GSQGGFVAGPEVLRDHVVNTARSFIFDTGLAPACAAAAARAARIVAGSPELVAGLHVRADAVARICGVRRAPGAVQSVPVGDASVAVELAGRVAQRGVGVGCFRPPSVPDGVSRLRLSVDGSVPLAQVQEAARVVREVVDGAGVGRGFSSSVVDGSSLWL